MSPLEIAQEKLERYVLNASNCVLDFTKTPPSNAPRRHLEIHTYRHLVSEVIAAARDAESPRASADTEVGGGPTP